MKEQKYKRYKPSSKHLNQKDYVVALESYVWYLEKRMDKLDDIIKGGKL